MPICHLAKATFMAALIPLLIIPTTTGAVDAMLNGFEAVPAISTTGTGTFVAYAVPGGTFEYTLTYSGTVGTVTQAHIHIGQMGVTGGISIFLCTNLMNGPDGDEPACPESVPEPASLALLRLGLVGGDLVGATQRST